MQVTQVKNEGLNYQFKVVVPANDVSDAVEKRLVKLAGQVKMPGFRPGKVPMNIVRDRYAQSVRGEVVESLVNTSTSKALTEKGLRAAVQPKIELEGSIFDEAKDLEFVMNVEVLPTFTPTDVTAISLTRPTATVDDAAVEKRLSELATRLPRTETAPEGHAAQNGDTVVVSFTGTLDGQERSDMTADKFPMELGSNDLGEGFDEQLVGAKAGDSRTVTITFAADHPNKDFAGKKAVFSVSVSEVRLSKPAEIDDAFAKMLGAKDVESLKNSIKSSLEAEYAAASRGKVKRELMDKLADLHNFDVPASMVDNEFNGIWAQIEADRARGTLDAEDAAKSEDTLKTDYRKIAERRVRLGLLLAEIGTQQSVRITNQDLQQAVRNEAMRYPGQEQQVIEFYSKNPQAVQAIQAAVFEDKVVDTIIEKAKVSDKTVQPEELYGE